MRRILATVGIAAIAFAACGGDDDDSGEADGATDATTTTVAESPEPTDAAVDDEQEPTTETTAAENPLLDVIRNLAGSYEGSWTNTTFGSTGSASMTVTLDEAAAMVTAEVDLGGNVFGASDPDPETFPIALDVDNLGQPFTVSSATFGEITAQLMPDGTLSIDAPDVPGANIKSFTGTAQFTGSAFEGTYRVEFESGGTPAEGTFSLAKS